jgi:thiosulfate reductase cytochrome b subunit
MMKIVKKHSLATRWMHWVNLPLLALMIWSGLLIYWANDVYGLWVGHYELFHFFPNISYDFLGVDHRLAEGMSIHFFTMWFFAVNGVAYVTYTFASGAWRELVPDRRSFKEAFQVVLHDLHLSRYSPPATKYNAAQRFAYTGIILMGIGSLLTGLSIYKPTQLSWLTKILGGYSWARWEHFWLTIGYVMFFVVHIVQVIRAGWNNFRGMVSGREFVDEKPLEGPLLDVVRGLDEYSNAKD